MYTEDKLLLGGAALAAAMFYFKDSKTGESIGTTVVNSIAKGAGETIGSAPAAFVGGVAEGAIQTPKTVGNDLTDLWIKTEPDWLLATQRWIFQQLPSLY